MKCPYCGFNNIAGTDTCNNCQEDLSSRDGISAPKGKIERILMSDPIAKIPPHDAVCVGADTTILDAIKKMNQFKSGCVLITNRENQLKGILTERDILSRVAGKVADLSRTKVSEVMTPHVEALDEDDTLAFALHKMSVNRFRNIAIRRMGKPPAVVSVLDLLKYLSKLFSGKSA